MINLKPREEEEDDIPEKDKEEEQMVGLKKSWRR